MKLFKNTLVILALFTINSVCAKRMGGAARPAGAATPPALSPRPEASTMLPAGPAPALPARSFNHHMEGIRKMKSADVIKDEDGNFTNSFITMVKSSGLAPEFMQELLEAGRNLHLPLSGNDEIDMAVITYNDAIIADFMANLEPAGSIPYAGSVQQPVLSFYNTKTNLLDRAWLENTIKDLLDSNVTDDQLQTRKTNIISAMIMQWKKRNIQNIESLKTEVTKQFDDTVKMLKVNQPKPKAQAQARFGLPSNLITQAINLSGTIKENDIQAWLNTEDASDKFIYTLLDKLTELQPDAVKKTPREETATNILKTFIVSYNGNEEGVKSEAANIALLKAIMAEKNFGVDVIKK